jgi:hypothetical protein
MCNWGMGNMRRQMSGDYGASRCGSATVKPGDQTGGVTGVCLMPDCGQAFVVGSYVPIVQPLI